jgi:hypothetical protein
VMGMRKGSESEFIDLRNQKARSAEANRAYRYRACGAPDV